MSIRNRYKSFVIRTLKFKSYKKSSFLNLTVNFKFEQLINESNFNLQIRNPN